MLAEQAEDDAERSAIDAERTRIEAEFRQAIQSIPGLRAEVKGTTSLTDIDVRNRDTIESAVAYNMSLIDSLAATFSKYEKASDFYSRISTRGMMFHPQSGRLVTPQEYAQAVEDIEQREEDLAREEAERPFWDLVWHRVDPESLKTDWPEAVKDFRARGLGQLFRPASKGGIAIDEIADELERRNLMPPGGGADALIEKLKEMSPPKRRRKPLRVIKRVSLNQSFSADEAQARLDRDVAAWKKAVDGIAAQGKEPSSPVLMLSQTPLVFQLLGTDTVTGKAAAEGGIYAAPHVFDGTHPNMTPEMWKQIPEAMTDPIAVFDSDSPAGRANGNLVFMLELQDANGATVVVPVALNARGRNKAHLNIVKSAYTKEQNGKPSSSWFVKQAQKNARYINGQKWTLWAAAPGSNSPLGVHNVHGNTVYTEADLVNLKNQNPTLYQAADENWVYRGSQQPDSPYNETGHAMWASGDSSRVDGTYAGDDYERMWALNTEDLPSIHDFDDDIRASFERSKEMGDFPGDMGERYADAEELIALLDPDDIVDTAGAWDDMDAVQWLGENVFGPREDVPGVKLWDGAITFLGRDNKIVNLREWSPDVPKLPAEGKTFFQSVPATDESVEAVRQQYEGRLYQDAYNGSQRRFNEFSTDVIGRGVGAQFHGWGLYFTQEKKAAENYRGMAKGGQLTHVDIPENDVLLDEQLPFEKQPENVRKGLLSLAEKYGLQLFAGYPAVESLGKGKGFRVRLPEPWEPSDYPHFKKKAEAFEWLRENKKEHTAFQTGLLIYSNLKSILGSDRAASEALNSVGIKGISYISPEGRCFVVFDDKAIKVLNRYYHDNTAARQARGFVEIAKGHEYTIQLLQNANLSTLLHETGHIALSEMEHLMEMGLADDKLRADYQKIREYLGLKEGDNLSNLSDPRMVQANEKFAKAMELYLREGKAPSANLEGAFSRFKRWLMRIYKSVTDNPYFKGVTLNEDIRGVFDRLLANDAEIRRAAEKVDWNLRQISLTRGAEWLKVKKADCIPSVAACF